LAEAIKEGKASLRVGGFSLLEFVESTKRGDNRKKEGPEKNKKNVFETAKTKDLHNLHTLPVIFIMRISRRGGVKEFGCRRGHL